MGEVQAGLGSLGSGESVKDRPLDGGVGGLTGTILALARARGRCVTCFGRGALADVAVPTGIHCQQQMANL